MANPKGDVPSNLGFRKEKDQGFKASEVKVSFPFTDYCQMDSHREDLPLNGTCLRDKTNKARKCAAVVSTSNINDYLKYI